VRLNQLSLKQFRNIQNLNISPGEKLNFFVGDNAQGKTSLLEAIYFLSTLKSFRPGKISDLIKTQTDGFQIEAKVGFKIDSSEFDLKARVQNGQKKLFLNEKATTSSNFISKLRVVVFSPDSLAAIKYGPELRRELVDQAVFQISTKAAIAQEEYLHVLKQRNACLKQMKNALLSPVYGQGILESLETAFLRAATDVTFYRIEFLNAIKDSMAEIISQIMGIKTNIYFMYQSDATPWIHHDYSAIQERLTKALREASNRSAETALGSTLIGPHRHDIGFIFNKTNSRIYCSQGQQRALILSFKMAEIVYHGKAFDSYPLLLLDDVLSEFDEKKRMFLIDFLRSHRAQTFLTATEQVQDLRDCHIFRVKAGELVDQKLNGQQSLLELTN
jgi:DNA replication and repair protein RecF